jgi:formate dehydrogenase major subunit
MFEAMDEGTVKGLIVLGENPALGPNGGARRKAMSKLDWLVVHDVFESETASFWKSAEGKGSGTEVFLFPAPTVAAIDGTVTNVSRWVQWQQHAISLTGEDAARKQAILLAHGLATRLKQAYQSDGEFPEPIKALSWWDRKRLDPVIIMFEIGGNKYDPADEQAAGKTLKNVGELMTDGSTRCGCWLYLGASEKGIKRRHTYSSSDRSKIGLYPGFAWSWPNNIKIMYNRAGAGKDGKAYNSAQVLAEYAMGSWGGSDILDGPRDAPQKIRAFTATRIGVARLFTENMVDGPFPEFYEPVESKIKNVLEPTRQNSPLLQVRKLDKIAAYGSDASKKYPILGLTYSLAEHHSYGQVTRYSKGARETVPAFYIEVGADLAKEKGIANGDKVTVTSARSPKGITGFAIVTGRLNAIRIVTENLFMIAVPENFGFVEEGPPGAPAHDLTVMSGDPNTGTAACRMFLCDIAKA